MQCMMCAIDPRGFSIIKKIYPTYFSVSKILRKKETINEKLEPPGFRSLGVRDGNGVEGPNEDQPTIIFHMITLTKKISGISIK